MVRNFWCFNLKNDKKLVHDYWDESACGENLYLKSTDKTGYISQAKARYNLEGQFIFPLAGFRETKGLKVLEIGIGLGADHKKFAEAGAYLWGIDLTERSVEQTRNRLKIFGLHSKLAVGDAEKLDFPDKTFDYVYSWGVLHHSPNTPQAISELWRVLKHGGKTGIMIYHKWSMVGLMLWLRYALIGMKPWLSLKYIYDHHLESPGTKAYSVEEARMLFSEFSMVEIDTVLTHGDLLESDAGQRHYGVLLTIARKLWPRWFIKRFFPKAGLFMLITATK